MPDAGEDFRWLRALHDSAPLAMVVEDAQGQVVGWNAAAERLFGWTRDEVAGRTAPFIPEGARDELDRRRTLVFAGDTPPETELECVRRDGAPLTVSVASAPFAVRGGPVTGALAVYADISERRRAERQLTLQIVVTRILSECETAEEAVTRTIHACCEVLGWACGARWDLDRASGLVRCLETWGPRGDATLAEFVAETRGLAFIPDASGGPVQRVAALAATQWVEDLGEETDTSRVPLALRAGLRSACVFPIVAGDESFGAIELLARDRRVADVEAIGLVGYLGSQIGQFMARREAERNLEFVASHDPLTGLPNRALFNQRLNQVLAQSSRHDRKCAVLFVDLDRFKVVNDTMGHEAGDRLLKDVSERLRGTLREGDTVARQGGDEFVVLIEEFQTSAQLAGVGRKIVDRLAQAFTFDAREFHISASVGIATYPADGTDAQSLMKHADIAMYRAKEGGKNQYQFYSPAMNRHSVDRLAVENALRHAVGRGELLLHYQPKFEAAERCMVAMEALVRWRRPGVGMVHPADFIPLAEETGLAVAMGEWVLRAACAQAARWRSEGLAPVRVAVNLSPRHFAHEGFVACVSAALADAGLPAEALELELTEVIALRDAERASRVLTQLEAMGVRFALDDFGTGYSSLSCLKRLPLDTVKVDRSFIAHLPGNPDDAAIARAVIAMAHSLRIRVVAEGVETEEQARFLRIHGCDEMQGNLFSPPLAPEDAALLLGRETASGVKRA